MFIGIFTDLLVYIATEGCSEEISKIKPNNILDRIYTLFATSINRIEIFNKHLIQREVERFQKGSEKT